MQLDALFDLYFPGISPLMIYAAAAVLFLPVLVLIPVLALKNILNKDSALKWPLFLVILATWSAGAIVYGTFLTRNAGLRLTTIFFTLFAVALGGGGYFFITEHFKKTTTSEIAAVRQKIGAVEPKAPATYEDTSAMAKGMETLNSEIQALPASNVERITIYLEIIDLTRVIVQDATVDGQEAQIWKAMFSNRQKPALTADKVRQYTKALKQARGIE